MERKISELEIIKISGELSVEQQELSQIPELNSDELTAHRLSEGDQARVHTSTRKEIPSGLWDRCKNCEEMIYAKTRQENLNICPKCGYHYPLDAYSRIQLISDKGAFKEIDAKMTSVDTLKFTGVDSYVSKLQSSKQKSGLHDAVVSGTTALGGIPYAIGVMDFRFLGASMGSVVGEKLTRVTELATQKGLPLVIVTASGGARMYEGMLSLMQMAKTSAALKLHQLAKLPYIVIMTNPTYAGVTASFASLGDLIVAEPGAMIGFAGPRVIKDTTQSQLPDGFQSSEFLLKKGLIDRIISRKNLREELQLFLECFCTKKTKKQIEKTINKKETPPSVVKVASKVKKAIKPTKAVPKMVKVASKTTKTTTPKQIQKTTKKK